MPSLDPWKPFGCRNGAFAEIDAMLLGGDYLGYYLDYTGHPVYARWDNNGRHHSGNGDLDLVNTAAPVTVASADACDSRN